MKNARATALNFDALYPQFSRISTAFEDIFSNDSARMQPSQTLVNQVICKSQGFSDGNSGKSASNVQSKTGKTSKIRKKWTKNLQLTHITGFYPFYQGVYFGNLEREKSAPENKRILPRLLTYSENKRGEVL